jgi:SAM-dependent methyltransferase
VSLINEPGSDYYETNYRSYQDQNPGHKLDHYVSVVEQACAPIEAPTLLDIGCGLGAFLAHAAMRRPHWTLYGTDIRPDAIEAAAGILQEQASLETAPAETRPFGDVTYDVITAWDVLEHLDDPAETVSNLKTWLKPGGVLVFVVPVYDGITGPLVTLLDKDPTHMQKLGRDFWVDLADSQLSRVSWHGILRYLLPGRRYLHLPTQIGRRFTPAILVVAHRDD